MKMGVKIGIGVAAAIGAYALLRPRSTTAVIQTAGGPVAITVPSYSASQVSSAIASGREAMIQRIMAHDHVTREVATARYDQLAPTIGAALTRGASGFGGYYRG
jgi:hypothetical protein